MVAQQGPLSKGFPRQESWSGLLCTPPGDCPNPGIGRTSPHLLHLLHWQADSSALAPPGKPFIGYLLLLMLFSHPVVYNSFETKYNSPPHHPKFAQVSVHCIGDGVQPAHPLTLFFPLPSIFPSIRDFSNVCIRCQKYWSFSISPSNKYIGLRSLMIDWFDLLAARGTL